MTSWGRRGLTAALVVTFLLPAGAASAYWSTQSAAGGSGASAATAVSRGGTPSATVLGDAVTVAWPASTLASGVAVTGYVVRRYDQSSLTPQEVLTSCAGRLTATSCTEHGVPDGQWRYSVTPLIGTSWAGPESPLSSPVSIDSSPSGPPLRSAASYSVLGGTGVTSTLATTISGDLGLSTSGAIAGFPPGIVAGDINDKNAAAAQAQVDLGLAYADAAARTPTDFFAGDQIGATFHAGVHSTDGAFANTGTMTLDGGGDPNALFIFQIDAAMSPAAGSGVVLVNGATASHVFWQVNGAVTVAANASVPGTLLVNGAITLGDGVVFIGRALATGAVTMADNTIQFTAAPAPRPAPATSWVSPAGAVTGLPPVR